MSSCGNSRLWNGAPGCGQFRREHLVHATAIEIDNFKAPAIHVQAIAHRRQLSEAVKYKASDSVIGAILGKRNPC